MSATTSLHIGSLIRRQGRIWTVAELHAHRALLRSSSTSSVVSIDELVDDPYTTFDDEDRVPGDDCGVLIDELTGEQRAEWTDKVDAVREVLTGYRSGFVEDPQPFEPKPCYLPDVAMDVRYRAKASELAVSVRSVRRWVETYRREGPAALIDHRGTVVRPALAGLDPRWVNMCRRVCNELTYVSTHTKKYVLFEVDARLRAEYSDGVVRVPGRTRAYEALDEITRGTNMFRGSAKGRREIADRPEGLYGQLRATRLGEYVILDTNRLDVYAMDRLTRRWVNTELTAAMDVYGRIICGLRLAPISTKSADVASVLFEVVCPHSAGDQKQLPFVGIPEGLLVPIDAADRSEEVAVPVESVVVDHGKVFMSKHIRAVMERFGISIQPVRTYKGSDKGPLERWFRTVRQGLLEYLDGYMGPDLYSRGKDAEKGAFYFVDELETIIRRWIREIYHERPHRGLVLPADPHLRLSPHTMYDIGIATTGYRRIPTSRDTVYDFLPVAWRKINHYGIDFHGLKYDDDILAEFVERTSPYAGSHKGKYPIRYDPADISCIYFHHPDDHSWHRIEWIHARDLEQPFSLDALTYARRLAAQRDPDRFPDDWLALTELLEGWNKETTLSRRERKIAVQMLDDTSASQIRLELDDRAADRDPIRSMDEDWAELTSDDDHETDGDEPLDPGDLDDYYKDATEILPP